MYAGQRRLHSPPEYKDVVTRAVSPYIGRDRPDRAAEDWELHHWGD